jgi:hypothetical protein
MNVFLCRERQVSVALVWFSMFVIFIQNVTSKHSFLYSFTMSQILASGIATATEETEETSEVFPMEFTCHKLTPV